MVMYGMPNGKAPGEGHVVRRRRRRHKDPRLDKWNLTPKQQRFVKAYIDRGSPTFLDKTASAKVSYNCKNDNTAHTTGWYAINNRNVAMAIRECLGRSRDRIEDLIERGVVQRLEDPFTSHWQPTADFVAKINGDFAPEKTINVNITKEEREAKYRRIMEKIRGIETEEGVKILEPAKVENNQLNES